MKAHDDRVVAHVAERLSEVSRLIDQPDMVLAFLDAAGLELRKEHAVLIPVKLLAVAQNGEQAWAILREDDEKSNQSPFLAELDVDFMYAFEGGYGIILRMTNYRGHEDVDCTLIRSDSAAADDVRKHLSGANR